MFKFTTKVDCCVFSAMFRNSSIISIDNNKNPSITALGTPSPNIYFFLRLFLKRVLHCDFHCLFTVITHSLKWNQMLSMVPQVNLAVTFRPAQRLRENSW